MTLGEKIKEARKQAGISQEQLAEKMGISRSAVAKWEVNNGMPDIENLKLLANLLGVTIDYLVDENEDFEKIAEKEEPREGGNKIKKIKSIMWGIALISVGIVFALNALNIADFDMFFDGWWTLFIIVPCAVDLFVEREKTGNIIGLIIGVFLLLCCREILSFSMLWKMLIPAIIVIVGLKMILSGLLGNKADEIIANIKASGGETKVGTAIFSGQDMNYDGEVFEGAELSAIFGGVECNLKNAIIEKDCAIKIEAIFGGIDIFVPDNVNVSVKSNCIFGGISNKTPTRKNVPTLYITGTCVFGGVDIK